MEQKRFHIGTSGWYYRHWIGPFYPRDVSKVGFLPYYATRLETVEINASFYRLPQEGAFIKWRDETPPDFLFAVKASRLITHLKRLKNAEEAFSAFIERAKILGDKLGVILFQLPPGLKRDVETLEGFLKMLPRDYRYAFEFRNPDWFHEKTYKVLEKYRAAFCIFELGGVKSPLVATSDFVYVRLHGPGVRYGGRYNINTLEECAETMSHWMESGKEVFYYFDNDEAGYAAINALELSGLLRHKLGL